MNVRPAAVPTPQPALSPNSWHSPATPAPAAEAPVTQADNSFKIRLPGSTTATPNQPQGLTQGQGQAQTQVQGKAEANAGKPKTAEVISLDDDDDAVVVNGGAAAAKTEPSEVRFNSY